MLLQSQTRHLLLPTLLTAFNLHAMALLPRTIHQVTNPWLHVSEANFIIAIVRLKLKPAELTITVMEEMGNNATVGFGRHGRTGMSWFAFRTAAVWMLGMLRARNGMRLGRVGLRIAAAATQMLLLMSGSTAVTTATTSAA